VDALRAAAVDFVEVSLIATLLTFRLHISTLHISTLHIFTYTPHI
jgi:hypothetical protein